MEEHRLTKHLPHGELKYDIIWKESRTSHKKVLSDENMHIAFGVSGRLDESSSADAAGWGKRVWNGAKRYMAKWRPENPQRSEGRHAHAKTTGATTLLRRTQHAPNTFCC